MEDEIVGRKLRVGYDNSDKDFFYTVGKVIRHDDNMILFYDKFDQFVGINKRYIKEII